MALKSVSTDQLIIKTSTWVDNRIMIWCFWILSVSLGGLQISFLTVVQIGGHDYKYILYYIDWRCMIQDMLKVSGLKSLNGGAYQPSIYAYIPPLLNASKRIFLRKKEGKEK